MRTCHVEVRVGGESLTSQRLYCTETFCYFTWIEDCIGKTASLVAVLCYTFSYLMHLMHLCYAKAARWKEFHHWEMEFCPSSSPWTPVLLEGKHCTLEKNPLHSNLVELTYMALRYYSSMHHRYGQGDANAACSDQPNRRPHSFSENSVDVSVRPETSMTLCPAELDERYELFT